MRIGVIGPLGLPAATGGITRHSEELYARLAERGHDVTIFGRAGHVPRAIRHRGVYCRPVPAPGRRGWETLGYGASASVLAARGRFDVVHYQGVASASFCDIPRLAGAPLALTVHSTDWAHDKWGRAGRTLLRWTERRAVRTPRVVICVSRTLREAVAERHPGTNPVWVPNGVVPVPNVAADVLEPLGLRPGGYVLFVGRLVPEKGVDVLVDAFGRLPANDVDLAIVGEPRHSAEFEEALRRRAGERVKFLGPLHGTPLFACYNHALALVAPSRNEGLPLVVLEAMSAGCPVIASDIPAHVEVLEGSPFIFRTGDAAALAAALRSALEGPDALEAEGRRLHGVVSEGDRYNWDAVATETEKLLIAATR